MGSDVVEQLGGSVVCSEILGRGGLEGVAYNCIEVAESQPVGPAGDEMLMDSTFDAHGLGASHCEMKVARYSVVVGLGDVAEMAHWRWAATQKVLAAGRVVDVAGSETVEGSWDGLVVVESMHRVEATLRYPPLHHPPRRFPCL